MKGSISAYKAINTAIKNEETNIKTVQTITNGNMNTQYKIDAMNLSENSIMFFFL